MAARLPTIVILVFAIGTVSFQSAESRAATTATKKRAVVVAVSNDDTLRPGAVGPGVADAVCARLEATCVFPDDKLFTRRLAFVESADGNDPNTFRDGYYGGIWQVGLCRSSACQQGRRF